MLQGSETNSLNMETDFDRIKPEFSVGTPRIVSFHSPCYTNQDGQITNITISVKIENGDVYGMLNAVAENGGIGARDEEGVYRFIPWPNAAVEVRDL